MTIEVTEKAIANVKRFMESENKPNNIVRVGVRGGGCSGLSYVLQFEDAATINMMDQVIEKDGVRIVVDKKSMLYLAGTTLDYEDGLSGKGFTFKNPNARQACGCGESFSL
ncbi:MAG: iron-sulfur cluster assembly accessory protein [Nitrospinaceae bacterium]|nr:iron-sulfur cluster assembly accessory protein [Nitrospinaceae bacterium]MBT3432413.1 iron-sulfur cluster assembly accessory protein [Nitrospinaceae bacterium]MBT4095694.1 iron-sulfur cluster assembly accessory protein [Nitrospinaceae bacterium]MBT4429959.1 iron-sulfur cluster assembly accessory protein [Nitrospinaceae bacterium]MBT5366809.1 iron-sulfur cluster assembly accessory protein [Nitrospinaceae bacterium]